MVFFFFFFLMICPNSFIWVISSSGVIFLGLNFRNVWQDYHVIQLIRGGGGEMYSSCKTFLNFLPSSPMC